MTARLALRARRWRAPGVGAARTALVLALRARIQNLILFSACAPAALRASGACAPAGASRLTALRARRRAERSLRGFFWRWRCAHGVGAGATRSLSKSHFVFSLRASGASGSCCPIVVYLSAFSAQSMTTHFVGLMRPVVCTPVHASVMLSALLMGVVVAE